MTKSVLLLTTAGTQLLAGMATAAPGWNVNVYSTLTEINNYATADALIGGRGLAFSNTSSYATSNTQDNADGGGPFGLGVQLAGLPAGDNNEFAFRGLSNFTVTAGGTYTFSNDTDDGSRLRISVNGGAYSTIITDDVLSGPHTVTSSGITLNPGDTVSLDWMWFEHGGGAEGETFYQRNGGANALWQDASQGLSLAGGVFNGTLYKSIANLPAPTSLALADGLVTSGRLMGTAILPTINMGVGGHAGAEDPIPGGGGDSFVVSATGYITLAGGDYTFLTNTDDGARLRIDGNPVVLDEAAQPPTDSAYVSVNLAPGTHFLEYTGYEIGGGESFEVWMAAGNFAAGKGAGAFGANFHLIGDATFPVSTVPEPAAPVLAVLSLAGLVSRRRRS